MTKQHFFIYFIVGVLMLMSQSLSAKTLQVKVDNIDPTRGGNIMVLLYARSGFPKDHSQALEIKTVEATQSSMSFSFEVDTEFFAIKVLHDEDKTGTVSKNWTGIVPSEGLGFSNNARLTLSGPPSFRRAALALEQVKDVHEIKLRYPRQRKNKNRSQTKRSAR